MSVYDWSTTASSNDTADASINWQEGQNANTVNNSARAMMAAVAGFLAQTNGSITSGGTANAQTFTSPAGFAFSGYSAGMVISFKAGAANTASTTINVDGLGAKTIKKLGSTNLAAGDIVSGGIYTVIYDGTNFQLMTNALSTAYLAILNSTSSSVLSGLTPAADRLPYFDGASSAALATFTSAGRALLDDASASAQRTTLGLGTMSLQNAGGVAITGGSVTGITDIALADGGTGSSTASGARSNLGIGSMATRNYTASTSAASGGSAGDVWFQYV